MATAPSNKQVNHVTKVMATPSIPTKTYKDVLNEKQQRFWRQANQIMQLGGTLSAAQKQTYDAMLNTLKKQGVSNPTYGLEKANTSAYSPLVDGLTDQQERFWRQANAITSLGGTLSAAQQQTYNKIANSLKGMTDQKQLQDLSIRALNGDVQAQNFLKQIHVNPLTGKALWSGYDPSKLQQGTKAYKQYMIDNPYSDIAKQYDLKNYQIYTERIKNGQPLSPDQMKWYQQAAQKWNLPDYTDPLVSQREQMKQDEQSYMDQMNKTYQDYIDQINKTKEDIMSQLQKAQQSSLDSQDVALNNALAQADQDNFQRFLDLQQQMTDRGMADSGIAADAYLRSQMAANQAYQDAYSQAAQNKANIQSDFANQLAQYQSDFTDKLGQINLDKLQNQYQIHSDYMNAINELSQRIADNKAKEAAEIQARQDERDKFLTQQTGVVYMDGKPVMGKDGKPLTTIEYQKMLETQRHNKAVESETSRHNQVTEKTTAVKVANDYDIAKEKLDVDRAKIAADVQKAQAQLKLAYDKLSVDSQKANAAMKEAAAKLEIAGKNAATSEMKAKISAIRTQIDSLQKQIGKKKPTKAQKDQLNKLLNQLSELVSGK